MINLLEKTRLHVDVRTVFKACHCGSEHNSIAIMQTTEVQLLMVLFMIVVAFRKALPEPYVILQDPFVEPYVILQDPLVDVTRLLTVRRAAVNVCDARGWTPLHSAASSRNIDIVKNLLKNGANKEALAYA